MRTRKYNTTKTTIADAVSAAFGDLQSLGEEMREWADNLEEKFSQTDRYQRVNDAADTLENISEVDVPSELADLEVEWTEVLPRSKRKPLSRSDRCENACSAIEAVIGVLDDLDEDHKHKEDADTLRDDLDNAKSEAESVEFPGMYG